MDVPVSGCALFVANNIFAMILWYVSAFYLLSFSQSSSTKNRLRGAAVDLVPLSFGYALSRHASIPFM